MNKIYLLLGSNMGNTAANLTKAQQQITKKIGKISRQSRIYQTAAWGKTDQPDFLNQVLQVETHLSPSDSMACILNIESALGRIRTEKNAPRIIDIDILFFNKEVINSKNLVVPHPAIPDRRFVLVPLNEMAPGLKHPVSGLTIHRLLLQCKDSLNVKKY